MHVHLQFKGLAVARTLRAVALERLGDHSAAAIAAQRWGEGSTPATILRTAVGSSWSSALAGTADAAEWIGAVRDAEVLTRLPGLRRVAPLVRHFTPAEGATAGFVAEGSPIPISAIELSAESMRLKKVAGIVVATKESLQSWSVESENGIQIDLIRAAADASDRQLLDIANTGSEATPASLTNGAPTMPASGNAAADFAALIELHGGDLLSSAFVMHPRVAVQLNMHGGEQFRDLGATGGIVCGLPVLTSRASPEDTDGYQITLIDGSGIVASEGAPEFTTSEAATLQLETSPDDPLNPSSTSVVGLFQADAIALKVLRRVVWRRARAGAVTVLTGASYTSGS